MTEQANEEAVPPGAVFSSFHQSWQCRHDMRKCVECGESFEGCSMQPKRCTCSKMCWNRYFRQGANDKRQRRTTKKLAPVQGDERWCSACSEWKPISEFRTKTGNIQSRCKPCASAYQTAWRNANINKVREAQRAHSRRRYIRNKYGIERHVYEARRDTAMKNGCEICGGWNENGKPLHQDHCHTTGNLRGFLCENCNRGLGMYKDNPERLRAAADYLVRHSVEC